MRFEAIDFMVEANHITDEVRQLPVLAHQFADNAMVGIEAGVLLGDIRSAPLLTIKMNGLAAGGKTAHQQHHAAIVETTASQA